MSNKKKKLSKKKSPQKYTVWNGLGGGAGAKRNGEMVIILKKKENTIYLEKSYEVNTKKNKKTKI